MGSQQVPTIRHLLKPINEKKKVEDISTKYLKYFDHNDQSETNRKANALDVTDKYYDLATDFFEYGWGESFHFGTMNVGDTREFALTKHEYRLALKLGLKPGDQVLDIGCGVGGPARHIAAFTEAKVTGLNINDYQIERAKYLTKKAKLEHLCNFVKGDFCNAPFPSESISQVYAIEATCHASDDLSRVYKEVYRLLKPGGLFACYEWIMTDKYDSTNTYHRKIKDDILIGDGLPDLVTKDVVHECLKKVGFEVVEAQDLALTSEVPWYSTLQSSWTPSGFKSTPLGRWLTHLMLITMETARLVPKGSSNIHTALCKGADGLVLGGKEGIFTPMYMFVVKKPERDDS